MKKNLLFLFATVLSTGFSWSQCAPTCSSYAVSPITFTTYPSAGTSVISAFTPNADDGYTPPVSIGFNFNFYCSTYNTVLIYSNGLLQFDIGVPSTFPFGYDAAQLLPNATTPTILNGIIAFRMDDLDPGVGGTVTYATMGISPNQKFVLTYSNVPLFGSTTVLYSGQIVLHETTNIIDIISINAPQSTNLATQGIENELGTLATVPTASVNQGFWSLTNAAFRFSPYTPSPPSAVTGNTLLCQGDPGSYQATFIAGASGYVWNFPSGWTGTSTISAATAYAGASGNISVSATYTCGTSAPTVINVSVTAAPLVSITSVTPVIICSGKTITMTTSGAASYTVYPGGFGGTTSSYTDIPLSTTTYTLYGTNAQGCISVNNPSTMVTVNQTPLVSVNSGSICVGETFTITPAGAPNYAVTGNFFNVTPLAPGPYSYTVVGTGANGCLSLPVTSSLTVFNLPTVGVNATRTVMCTKESIVLTATGASTYLWATNSTSNVITISPTTNTNYIVTGTDIHGCKNTGMIDILVKQCTGIDESTGGLQDGTVYPNPTSGSFDVRVPVGSDKTTIEVYNALGQQIISEKTGAEITNINLKSYSGGIYYVKIKSAEQEKIIKVIKQ